MGRTQEVGSWAERIAAEWLLEHGFRLLHMNWREGRYELDIVAEKGDTVHFVEVKCRKKGALTAPEDAVTPAKFASLQKAAAAYIAHYGVDLEPQFDAIAIEYDAQGHNIRYIPQAMVPRW